MLNHCTFAPTKEPLCLLRDKILYNCNEICYGRVARSRYSIREGHHTPYEHKPVPFRLGVPMCMWGDLGRTDDVVTTTPRHVGTFSNRNPPLLGAED